MLKEKLHQACYEQDIKTAAGLHDRLKGTKAAFSYQIVRGLWAGQGKVINLVEVFKELGVKI